MTAATPLSFEGRKKGGPLNREPPGVRLEVL